jgi:hypothetical protein
VTFKGLLSINGSGNYSISKGRELRITGRFIQSSFFGAPNAYNVVYIDSNYSAGWVFEDELGEEMITISSTKESISFLKDEIKKLEVA